MTYEYQCLACQHEWETEQSISDSPLTECPSCHQPKAKRMISGGAGFILKGGGWYADGYGSAPAAASKGDEAKAGEPDASKSKDKAGADKGGKSDTSKGDKKDTKKVGESAGSESQSKGKSAST